MSDKQFKFTLYQRDVLLYERIFDANQINPFTRYSIDIRSILPKAITSLQKILSKNGYDTTHYMGMDGEKNHVEKNFYKYNTKIINSYPHEYRNEMTYKPKSITQNIENMVIKGVECKIGFYINDKTIVEREFFVDGFNPVSRWSIDLLETCERIANNIFTTIKNDDVKNMWDDYDLINKNGFTINQIREMTDGKRKMLLRRI